VRAVAPGDRKFWQLRAFRGGKCFRSKGTKIPADGKVKSRKAAHDAARDWQTELQSGDSTPGKITWERFRERFEKEVWPEHPASTQELDAIAFDHLQYIAKPVLLTDVDAEAVAKFKRGLRKRGNSASTIGIRLRHLRKALNWAVKRGMLKSAPVIEQPKDAKRAKAKGRAITEAEYSLIVDCVKEVIPAPYVAMWRHFIEGLWTGGLRIEEALRLSWEPDAPVRVVMSDNGAPYFHFDPEGHKRGVDLDCPIAPEFQLTLESVPDEDRRGYVFDVRYSARSERLTPNRVGVLLRRISKEAGVRTKPGNEGWATAHDFRRSFGTRWASRLQPLDLMELMRHESISTTKNFYRTADVQRSSSHLWAALEDEQRRNGYKTGNTPRQGNKKEATPVDVTSDYETL
jgi:integrase